MAALPQPHRRSRRPRKVLVLGRAAGFVHSSIPLAARTDRGDRARRRAPGRRPSPTTPRTSTRRTSNQVRRDLPGEHDRALPRRSARCRGDRGPPQGAARLRARRQGPRRHPCRDATRITQKPGAAAAPARARRRAARRPRRRQCRSSAAATGTRRTRCSAARSSPRSRTRGSTRSTPTKAGRVAQADFPRRFAAVMPPPPRLAGAARRPRSRRRRPARPRHPGRHLARVQQLIGGFFKFHWNDGQTITVKIDEPDHPLNAPFKGQRRYVMVDETYTFGRDTYSRENLRVLTSIDYAAMSAEDKAKEQYPRADGDYALSWIRREGQGRVFYMRTATTRRSTHQAAARAPARGHAVRARRSAGRDKVRVAVSIGRRSSSWRHRPPLRIDQREIRSVALHRPQRLLDRLDGRRR